MKIFTKLSCCCNCLTRNNIEISIIIVSIIGFIFSIIGMAVIPWGYTSLCMEIFYLLSLILFFYSFLVSCIIKLLHKIKIKETKMTFCNINALIIAFACIVSILLNIFIAFGLFPDLKNKKIIEKTEIIESNGNIKMIQNKEKLTTNKELTFAIFSIIINLLLWIILLFLWVSEIIRLKYKIEGSYNNYIIEQKNISMNGSMKPVLNVIGHDKYGFPIYAKKSEDKIHIDKSRSESNYKLYNKYNYKYDIETNNVLRYSYKEKFGPKTDGYRNYKLVDPFNKIKEEKKEKYIEKYIENGAPNPYYSNFENKSALNISSYNNSINPGY